MMLALLLSALWTVPAATATAITTVAAVAPATPATAQGDAALALVRARFRSHRPPPPFETYILTRTQLAVSGGLDVPNSYSKRVWLRTSDSAALTRTLYSDGVGPLVFDRPAFNEARDPGPPTADLFAPAPARPRPAGEAPTPAPVLPALPDAVEADYRVDAMTLEGDQLHLRIAPLRDPDRNRLRELFADKATYELRTLIATDKLFVDGNKIYPVTFTITMGAVQGIPVVTRLHGVVGGGYNDDGREVDYVFSNTTFPTSLPDWYFNPRTYAQHRDESLP